LRTRQLKPDQHDEIEITPEMMKAGFAAFADCAAEVETGDAESRDAMIVAIYRAMYATRS
jgi:hypothetical protein